MRKYFGGFFESEQNTQNDKIVYHNNALFLATGRACLNLIIQTVKPKCILVPFFTCDAVLEPIRLNNIPYQFYGINEKLEPNNVPPVTETCWFLYINYFGIKDEAVKKLASVYKHKLIIDNTHAFLNKEFQASYSFNSARKYFGVPDGAYLYSPSKLLTSVKENVNIRTEHLTLRKEGKQQEAFTRFSKYEMSIDSSINAGSTYSKNVLETINYEKIRDTRRQNFNYYHEVLGDTNRLQFDKTLLKDDSFVPFSYPYFAKNNIRFDDFYRENIFIPVYWNDVLKRENSIYQFETEFTLKTAHLPLDHRYGKDDIQYIVRKFEEIVF